MTVAVMLTTCGLTLFLGGAALLSASGKGYLRSGWMPLIECCRLYSRVAVWGGLMPGCGLAAMGGIPARLFFAHLK